MIMKKLAEKWLRRAERLRNKTKKYKLINPMTEQAYLAEAYALEVCADELKRKLKEMEGADEKDNQ